MARKPTYKELEQRIRELEKKIGKYQRAEEALGEISEFKEKIISESPIGMSIYDASGQCVGANDSIGELIGGTRKQVLEQNYNNIESWKKPGLLDKAKSAVRENSKKRHELKVKSSFGRHVSLDCHLVPFSSQGQTHLLVMVNDISERIKAEEALRESEERYRLLVETMNDGLGVQDEKGLLTYVNRRICEMLGYSRDEFIGRPVTDFLDDTNQKILKKEMARRRKGKRGFYELVWTGKKGRKICTLVSAEPIYDNKGHFEGSFAVLTDITKRRQAEEALRESEEKMRALLNAPNESALLLDTRGTILALNETAALRFGKNTDEVVGLCAYDLMPRNVSRLRKAKLAKVVRLKEPMCFEDEREGRVYDQRVYPVFDSKGKVTAVAVYAQDVTERKRADEALREREATLEIRTHELEELNTALTVLLKRREGDKTEVEEKVLLNVKELVVPYAEKLKKTSLNRKQMSYLNVLELNLSNIISPFTYKLSSKYLGLTPKEIHIANLVKDGKTAKEIAGLFDVSVRTIEFHRKSIRAKIGLKNSKINLRSRLLSM
jgi:PAS domain S-box-containing protein